MTYEYQREGGERLLVQNQDEQTTVQLHSRGMGQEQSQGSGFTTGAWSGQPKLFRQGDEWFLRLSTKEGEQVIGISRGGVRQQSGTSIPAGAEELSMQETDDAALPAMKPMKPMEPMRPMEPMKPMEPMTPFQPLF